MRISLEVVESESKDWKQVATISILNDLPYASMGHYSPDGNFLMDWTPDSSGKFMARVTLVSDLASGENVLAVSPAIGWIEVTPIYFAGLGPFPTVQS
jgi:hypothetical protein